jgi:hypothetical protein
MAWVQVGPHKINTAQICYTELDGETVRIYFHGEWEGNPLDLHFDEAKAFWRHLKAEDVMITRDKGSAAVMPKLRSSGQYDVHSDEKPKPAVASTSGSHGSSHSTSHSASHSSSHHARHDSHKKH